MTVKISGRAQKVLQRFPRHMEAEARGKLIASAVDTIVRDQDIQAADIQQIRIAHRVLEAKQISDLFLLAGLHGIRRADMSILYARQLKSCDWLVQLKQNIDADGDATERQDLAEAFLSLFALPADSPLSLFSQEAVDAPNTVINIDSIDINDTIDKLIPHAVLSCQSKVLLEGIRKRIVETCAIHINGNGTIRALLNGAANLLDLDMGEIEHSEDRYWHAAAVHDRIGLNRAVEAGTVQKIVPKTEYMGIEENPRVIAQRGHKQRNHAELFHYLRKGFDDAVLEIRVKGNTKRTISPMVVNRDLGHGVGFFGLVPEGQELVFTQGGRVTLDGNDVTSRAYAWQGACFAQYDAQLLESDVSVSTDRNDFVFADASASDDDGIAKSRFAEVTPINALDRDALLPHAGASLPMPSIGVGKTRFAFFVQHGYFSAKIAGTTPPLPTVFDSDVFASTPLPVGEHIELTTPRFSVGFADASVFATRGKNAELTPCGSVQLGWLERQAYKVKLLIPNRFRIFDSSNGDQIRDLVKKGIKRFRPAGVDIEVDFIEPFWLLSEAVLPEDISEMSVIEQIRSQPVLAALSTSEIDPVIKSIDEPEPIPVLEED
ncbi:MAG: hypothetical protein ACI97K_001778 [Glaciecola sp.]|jgi:hypothetical protein